MADTIKGLTISIGADTKKFTSEMKKVDKDINATQKQADALTKSLELEFDEGRFSQAQKLAQDAIEKTEQKAEALRQQLSYLEKTGADTSSASYKNLQTELIKTETKVVSLKDKLEQIKEMKIENLSKQFEEVGSKISSVGQALLPVTGAITGAIAGLGAMAMSTVSASATVDDLSQQIGLSAEELQKWQFIAMQTGLENAQLQTSLVKVQAGLADLASGTTSTASTALAELGISSEDAAKGMEANFSTIIERLSQIEDSTLRASYVNEIFGDKLGSKLIPLLNAGGQGVKELSEQFEELGYLTNEQVGAFAEFDDTLNVIKYSFTQIKNEIGVALLPLMKELAEYTQNNVIPAFDRLKNSFTSLSTSQQKVILATSLVVAAIGPALIIIGKIVSTVGLLVKSIGLFNSALTSLTSHPIIAIIGVIAALMTMLYLKNEEFKNSINELVEIMINNLTPILQTFTEIVKSLTEAIGPLFNILLTLASSILVSLLKAITPIISVLTSILLPVLNSILSLIYPIINLISTYLIPVVEKLGQIIADVFGYLPNIINGVLQFIEDMVNKVLDFINDIIRQVNKLSKYIGVTIDELEHVSLKMPETIISNVPSSGSTSNVPKVEDIISGSTTGIGSETGNIINNDYSNKDITINVTIENYADELDYDEVVRNINLKLAEQM